MVVLQEYMSSFGFKRCELHIFELNKNYNIYPSFLFYGVTLSAEMRDKWPTPKQNSFSDLIFWFDLYEDWTKATL